MSRRKQINPKQILDDDNEVSRKEIHSQTEVTSDNGDKKDSTETDTEPISKSNPQNEIQATSNHKPNGDLLEDSEPQNDVDNTFESSGSASPVSNSLTASESNVSRFDRKACDYCDFLTHSSDDLETHLQMHTGQRPFHCTVCQRSFKAKQSLQYHQFMDHGIEQVYEITDKCNTTQKRKFKNTGQMTKNPSLNRKQSCYVENSGGRFHKRNSEGRLESEVKKMKVENESTSDQESSSETSEKTNEVHGTSDRVCQYCFKTWRKPSDLKRHLMIHTGERPFACKECGKSFRAKGSMLYHMKAVHDCNVQLSQRLQERYIHAKHKELEQSEMTGSSAVKEEAVDSEFSVDLSFAPDITISETYSLAGKQSTVIGNTITADPQQPTSAKESEDFECNIEGIKEELNNKDDAIADDSCRKADMKTKTTTTDPALSALLFTTPKEIAPMLELIGEPKLANKQGLSSIGAAVRKDLARITLNELYGEPKLLGQDSMTSAVAHQLQQRSNAETPEMNNLNNFRSKTVSQLLKDKRRNLPYTITKLNTFAELASYATSKKVQDKSDTATKLGQMVSTKVIINEESLLCTRLKGTSVDTGKDVSFFRCYLCGKIYRTFGKFGLHYASEHESINCPSCDAIFNNLKALNEHCTLSGHENSETHIETNELTQPRTINGQPISYTETSAHSYMQNDVRKDPQMVSKLQNMGIGKHVCRFCGKRFSRPFALRRHERSHTGEKVCYCPECGKGFSEPRNLNQHMVRFHVDHTAIPQYLDHNDVGQLKFEKKIDTDRLQSQFGTRITCNKTRIRCKKSSKTTGEGEDVTDQDLDYRPSEDEEENSEGMDDDEIEQDLSNKEKTNFKGLGPAAGTRSSAGQDSVRCSGVWMPPNGLDEINSEIGTDGAENIASTKLNPAYKKNTSLSRTASRLKVVEKRVDRARVVQPLVLADGSQMFACIYCWKQFSNSADLNRHLDFHEDKRPFKCDFCEYHARTKSQLKVHQMRHQGIRQCHCVLCDYSCVTQSDLNRHRKSRLHQMRSENSCFECDESFLYNAALVAHQNSVHQTDKNNEAKSISKYVCQLCGDLFKSQVSLMNHYQDIHQADEDKILELLELEEEEDSMEGTGSIDMTCEDETPNILIKTEETNNTDVAKEQSNQSTVKQEPKDDY